MDGSEDFLVIALGASAGGLPALEEFFAAIAGDGCSAGAAYCLVQHLSPNFKSLMAQILERHTNLKIVVVDDGMEVEPGHLYLIRRDQHVTCEAGIFRLRPKEERGSVQFPIDLFLGSFARSFGRRAVAVILSGTGSDGSRGIQAIKAAGGEVLVQSPETAQFDGMPNAALASDVVDGVGSPRELAARLLATLRGDPRPEAEDAEPLRLPVTWREPFAQLIHILRIHSGIDFGQYKPATLMRRLEKHLALHSLSLPEYLTIVREREREREVLVRDFLIGVTSFFRDPAVFDALQAEQIPALLDAQGADEDLRLWVAACSSGEEAYSYGMILSEAYARRGMPPRFKILATDVDPQAIRVASEGRYPEAAVRGLSAQLREAYFVERDGDYVIRKALRERIIFSTHNILTDPPFVRLDLVSLRNVLIYLQPAGQYEALHNIAFGLRPGGLLVLGSSGAVHKDIDAFETVDARLRIFRRRQEIDVRWARMPHRLPLRAYEQEELRSRPRPPVPGVDAVTRALLEAYAPPVVVVDDLFRLLFVHGDLGRIFQLPQGPPSTDLRRMLRGPLIGVLSASMRQVERDQATVRVEGIPLEGSDGELIDLTVRRLVGEPPRFACEFLRRDLAETAIDSRPFSESDASRIAELEGMLVDKQEELQSLVEVLESANEELQSTNEELIAGNEELQSTNEELQSVNEELYTVNAELESRNSDLIALNNDVNNLLKTTDIATLLLDSELRIRRFTPAIREIFTLDPGDLGRPFGAFASTLAEPSERLIGLAAAILAGDESYEDRVTDRQGRLYLRRLHPFLTAEAAIEGVVLTLVDITGIEAMAAELNRHELQAEAAFDLLPGIFFEMRTDATWLRIRGDVGAFFPGLTGVAHELELAELAARILPEDRARGLTAFSPTASSAETVEFRLRVDDGQTNPGSPGNPGNPLIHVRGRSRVAEARLDGEVWITGVLLNVTEWIESEQELVRSRARLDMLMSNLPNGIVSVLDEQLRFVEIYGRELQRLRLGPEDVLGLELESVFSPEGAVRVRTHCQRALDDDRLVSFENFYGSQTYLINAMPVPSGVGEGRHVLVLSTNITELRATHDALRRAKEIAERASSSRLSFLASMSHELRTPLAGVVGLLDLLEEEEVSGAARGHHRQLRELVTTQERLIADLLDLSRIDADQLDIRCERFAVAPMLREIIDPLGDQARPTIAVEFDLPADDVQFVGDPMRIGQVVANLLSNALKYTEEGKVRVAVEVCDVGLRIEVRDTGVGIAGDDLPRIFDTFCRVGEAPRRAVGAGLGLAIVGRLVKQMGGSIDVESELDRGSTFVVKLPGGVVADQAPSLAVDDPSFLRGRRVLVVEDNAVIRLVVSELLRRDGAEVYEAVDGAGVLEVVAEHSVDAILMDIGLPDRSGLEVIAAIRASEAPGVRVPIIALTAYAYEEDIERSLQAGADLHLTKPAERDTLRGALRELLEPEAPQSHLLGDE